MAAELVIMTRHSQLLATVQDVLFREWDPIGVNHNELCRNEYDSYAPTVASLLLAGAVEYKLAAHLSQLQRVAMGMSFSDEEHHHRVARRLRSLLDVVVPSSSTDRLEVHSK